MAILAAARAALLAEPLKVVADDGQKILLTDLAPQAQTFGTGTDPFTVDAFALRVVVIARQVLAEVVGGNLGALTSGDGNHVKGIVRSTPLRRTWNGLQEESAGAFQFRAGFVDGGHRFRFGLGWLMEGRRHGCLDSRERGESTVEDRVSDKVPFGGVCVVCHSQEQ